jgi:hypothetical protein
MSCGKVSPKIGGGRKVAEDRGAMIAHSLSFVPTAYFEVQPNSRTVCLWAQPVSFRRHFHFAINSLSAMILSLPNEKRALTALQWLLLLRKPVNMHATTVLCHVRLCTGKQNRSASTLFDALFLTIFR